MSMTYRVDLSIGLHPVWHDEPPRVQVSCHDQSHVFDLDRAVMLDFSFEASGTQSLQVEFLNKKDQDTRTDLGLDKAVIIDSVSFFAITDPRFVWQARYRPHYPEPWYSQQVDQGSAPPGELTNVDRLSWNGTWTLDFELPVFTWIHRLQDLGWIYR